MTPPDAKKELEDKKVPKKDDGVSLVRLTIEKDGKVKSGAKLAATEDSIDTYVKLVSELYHSKNGQEAHVISSIFDKDKGFYEKSKYAEPAATVRKETEAYDKQKVKEIPQKLPWIKGEFSSIAPLPVAPNAPLLAQKDDGGKVEQPPEKKQRKDVQDDGGKPLVAVANNAKPDKPEAPKTR